jgi:hypothetical protein
VTDNSDPQNTEQTSGESSSPTNDITYKQRPRLEESDFRPDPEIRARNENFMMTIMAISFTMIIALILSMAGLTSAFMADQVKGLQLVAWSMALFTPAALLHLIVVRIWLGGLVSENIKKNAYLLVISLLGALLFLWALASNTVFVFAGFIGANIFFPLFGRYILSVEPPLPKTHMGSFNLTPFSRTSMIMILFIGVIVGMGIGMEDAGNQATGRGLFARNIVAKRIGMTHRSIDLIFYHLIKSYRVTEAITSARKSGITVRILVKPETLSLNASDLKELLQAGAMVRVLPPDAPSWLRPYLIIDKRILIQGSKGWADDPIPFQRQLVIQANLILFERIRRMENTFNILWEHSKPLLTNQLLIPSKS